MPTRSPSSHETREFLTAEYQYIASTAAQANEDRARVSSFYLVAVGSLLAALLSTQLLDEAANPQSTSLLFSGLFLVLTLLGTSTVMQLARLRLAWYESMLAMNQLKEYILDGDKELQKAFRWRTRTLPPLFKAKSISFQQTVEVALLSGLTFGASVFFLQKAYFLISTVTWTIAVAAGALAFFFQLFIYNRALK